MPFLHSSFKRAIQIYWSDNLIYFPCRNKIWRRNTGVVYIYFGESPTFTFKEGTTTDNFSLFWAYVSLKNERNDENDRQIWGIRRDDFSSMIAGMMVTKYFCRAFANLRKKVSIDHRNGWKHHCEGISYCCTSFVWTVSPMTLSWDLKANTDWICLLGASGADTIYSSVYVSPLTFSSITSLDTPGDNFVSFNKCQIKIKY